MKRLGPGLKGSRLWDLSITGQQGGRELASCSLPLILQVTVLAVPNTSWHSSVPRKGCSTFWPFFGLPA